MDMENTLYYGDNLEIMRAQIADESVDVERPADLQGIVYIKAEGKNDRTNKAGVLVV